MRFICNTDADLVKINFMQPTTPPTPQPSSRPSTQPSSEPSSEPSSQPSSRPTSQVTIITPTLFYNNDNNTHHFTAN